jgi:hypothetical protein
MANRVILGSNGSDYGLFVSQHNDNVLSPSKQLAFDSRAFGGLPVHAFGEGILAAPTVTSSTPTATRSTSPIGYTNLGFTPLYALRWCYDSDITSGKAVRVYTPAYFESVEDVSDFNGATEEETVYTETKAGGATASAGASSIVITNRHAGKTVSVISNDSGLAPSVVTGQGAEGIYYAWIVFAIEDWTNGEGI